MTTRKALTLSIIIPVYNEQAHLKACLDAIASQTVMPDEVIVVDNNSTDKSAEIAQSYSFVKLVKETTQGYIPARSKGFDSANSDILGRIDADAWLSNDWVERVKNDFGENLELAGVTGFGLNRFKSIYAVTFISKITSRMYFWYVRGYLGVDVLWGANMAIRANWWQAVKQDACMDWHKVHEDQDLSLLIASKGGQICLDTKLYINFDGANQQNFNILNEYMLRLKKTKQYHINRGTFESPMFKSIAWPKRLMYILVTCPAVLFFRLTSLIYARRAKAHIRSANRQ